MNAVQDRKDRARRLLWALNGVAALLIVAVFMLMVMTAIAQQEVITRIKEQQLSLGYSSALAINREARTKRDELAELNREERQLSRQLRREQVGFSQSQRRWEEAWQALQPVLQRLRGNGVCEITLPQDAPFSARLVAVNEVRECQADPRSGPANTRLLASAQASARDFEQVSKQYQAAFEAFHTTKDRLEGTQQQKLITKLSPEQEKISTSFNEMDVLLSSWMLLGGFLVPFPPAMLQILLTFVSGLFGAVLITFVLLVYPKSLVDVTATTETWARIFLGGLIALCVYIVLLGGTAVLGSASGIVAAGTNYMAFGGIGILAGMFSDRVAFWLSERADSFFSARSKPAEKDGPK